MDLNLIRTFLEVCQTRHFGQAAENLHLTGSAVGARIKTLEEQLGIVLFLRLRNGIEPTPAAERLITQFRSMLSTWDQIRFLASVESSPQPNLTVAASPGVWESIDSCWVKRLICLQNDTRLRLEAYPSSEILRRLQQGLVDVALTMEQLSGTEVVSTKIGELKLSLMSDTPGRTIKETLATDYLHVDWSTSFNTQFLSIFPDYITAKITVSTAKLAADLLADFPGAAYLSKKIVERLHPFVELEHVEGAPEFHIPIFAAYASWTAKTAVIQSAIDLLSTSEIE